MTETWFEIQFRFGPAAPWQEWRNKRNSTLERPWPYKTKASAKRHIDSLVHGGLGWKSSQFRVRRVTVEVVS